MAKPTPVASAEEAAAMRRRLRRLVAAVAAGSADAEAFDEAAEALAKLRDAELGPRKDNRAGDGGRNKRRTEAAVPEHFLCPISSEIMRDPVVLASGQVLTTSTSALPFPVALGGRLDWMCSFQSVDFILLALIVVSQPS
jgi:hypothetical protein